MYKKISIEEELPPIDQFVICFYEDGEIMVYKRIYTGDGLLTSTEKYWVWNMRDGIADRTPKEGKITHWLKEVESDNTDYNCLSLENTVNNLAEIKIGVMTVFIPKPILKEMLRDYIKLN